MSLGLEVFAFDEDGINDLRTAQVNRQGRGACRGLDISVELTVDDIARIGHAGQSNRDHIRKCF